MDINGTYILNPAYYLRNDVKRCLIGAYDEARLPDLELDVYKRQIGNNERFVEP